MAQAPARPRRVRVSLWRQPLVLGLGFALGYGITQRLVALGLPALVQLGQGFDMRPFPGASLDSLRQRSGEGAESRPIRGDLNLLQLERQQAQPRQPLEQDQRPEQQVPEAASTPAAPPRGGGGLLEPPPPPQLPPPESP